MRRRLRAQGVRARGGRDGAKSQEQCSFSHSQGPIRARSSGATGIFDRRVIDRGKINFQYLK